MRHSGIRMIRFLCLAVWWCAGPAWGSSENPVYEVRPGDTLWSIAATTIGDASLWPALYRANRDQIKDPAQVYPGQKLTIPEVPPSSVVEVRRAAAELLAR